MAQLGRTSIEFRYDRSVLGIDVHGDGTADLWRHDGEASADVYMDLSTDWASRAQNEAGESVIVFHDDQQTALQFAVTLLTDYHLKWARMGLVRQTERSFPVNLPRGTNLGSVYRQRDH